jgi:hypothetical protein
MDREGLKKAETKITQFLLQSYDITDALSFSFPLPPSLSSIE